MGQPKSAGQPHQRASIHTLVPKINFTDVGNSIRFAMEHGEQVKYVKGMGWMVWDGSCWAEDDEGGAHRRARKTIARMAAEGHAMQSGRGEDLCKWAHQSEQHGRIQAMIAQAQSQEQVMGHAKEFDQHMMLLNVGNGVLDLETGRMRDHDPALRLTKYTHVPYMAGEKSELWLSFLKKAFDGDTDLIEYLQRAAGYSLTGRTNEDSIFICYGATGSNGKTTFLETMMQCLGSYSGSTGPQTFLKRNKGGHNTPELAKLRGLRFVGSYEAEKGAMFDEAQLKAMTGGDEIQASAKYKAPIEYRPEFKVWFRTNHLPIVDANDEGVWRRVHVIPFLHEFKGQGCDKGMRERLATTEAKGVLAWMIKGAGMWKRDGLGQPTAVRRTTKNYRLEQEGSIGLWLQAETVKDDTGRAKKPLYGLYRMYERWCGRHEHQMANAKIFQATMMERGYSRDTSNLKLGPGFWGLALIRGHEE